MPKRRRCNASTDTLIYIQTVWRKNWPTASLCSKIDGEGLHQYTTDYTANMKCLSFAERRVETQLVSKPCDEWVVYRGYKQPNCCGGKKDLPIIHKPEVGFLSHRGAYVCSDWAVSHTGLPKHLRKKTEKTVVIVWRWSKKIHKRKNDDRCIWGQHQNYIDFHWFEWKWIEKRLVQKAV